MKQLLAAAMLVVASSLAGADVGSGDYVFPDGSTVNLSVNTQYAPTAGEYGATWKDDVGSSPEKGSTPGAAAGTISDSPEVYTTGKGPGGATTYGGKYRVKGGKAQKKMANGKWRSGKRKKPKPVPDGGLAPADGGAGTSGTLPDEGGGGHGTPPALPGGGGESGLPPGVR
jgi:hypothetical protein